MKYCVAILLLALFAIVMAQKRVPNLKEEAPKSEIEDARNKRGAYGEYNHAYPYSVYPYGYQYHGYPYAYHGYPYAYNSYHYPYYGIYGGYHH
ncbi:prisilkin-39 [Harpegnathos saltator]|nr:prisilkin-39 [Harpegnathos saltator]